MRKNYFGGIRLGKHFVKLYTLAMHKFNAGRFHISSVLWFFEWKKTKGSTDIFALLWLGSYLLAFIC